jgi:hypothetical protein
MRALMPLPAHWSVRGASCRAWWWMLMVAHGRGAGRSDGSEPSCAKRSVSWMCHPIRFRSAEPHPAHVRAPPLGALSRESG